MYIKNEWQQKLDDRRQLALRNARERDGLCNAPFDEPGDDADSGTSTAPDIDTLQQQIAVLAAERDAARRQVQALESKLAAGSVRPRRRRTVTAAGVVLSVGILATAATFEDAQSTLQHERQSMTPADEATAPLDTFDALPTTATDAVTAEQTNDSPPPQTRKHRTRFASLTRSSHRQWGPPLLLLPEPPQDAKAGTRQFDPLVKTQQENLLALGFAVGKADGFTGPRTERALEEFKALYLSSADLKRPLSGAALIAITRNYADLARGDAAHFKVDQGVLAAIRLSSVRTGIDFAYLMKLAAVESNFNPVSKAAGSSATGLYQFTRDTWLNTVKAYGDNYGLGVYTEQIDYIIDRDGYRRPVVRDKAVYRHLLDLRTNPRVSAMMAAELVKNNLQRLVRSFDRTPSQADLYLTHFLGTDGAISFLKALDATPDALAVDMFPAAAQSNQNIFHPKTCRPRTVDEVYALFGQKFDTSRYDLATN